MSFWNKRWSQLSEKTKACIVLTVIFFVCIGIAAGLEWVFSNNRAFTNMVEPRLDKDGKVLDYQIFALKGKMADVVCSKFDHGDKIVIPCREGDELVMPGMKYWDMMAAQFGRPCDCNCKPVEIPVQISIKQVDKKVENGQACRTMLREYSDGHAEVEYQKFMAVNLANHEELWMPLTENCVSFFAKLAPLPNLTYSITSVMDDKSCVRCCKEK